MDKMKRVFSFVLVLAMLVGSFSSFSTVAFAEETKVEAKDGDVKVEVKVEKEEAKEVKEEVKADDTKVLNNVPKDVIGTDYEKAVSRLVAFGVIGGYPDGTYKPEEEINRAQFSKIIVMALGLNDAVPAAANKSTGFSDVQPGYWAAGYINVASGQGLLKGYPDGTFRPAKKVSYAETLTMLVRALGYQDEFLQGTWPGNYVAKAADVRITSGVQMPGDAKQGAKRGPVAQLVNNTFDAKVVKVDKYKPNTKEVEYYETKTTLLKEKLEISKHEDTRIFADKIVDDGLRKNEASVRFLQDTREKEEVRVAYKEGDKKDFISEINVRPFIGQETTTYLTDRDVVIYAEIENDDKANFDYVDEIKGKDDRVNLVKFDKDYSFEKDADVYVFDSSNDEYKYFLGEDLKSDDVKDILGRPGKFVVKNNKVVYAEVLDPSEAEPLMVVLENEKDVLKGVNKETEDFELNLTKDRDYDYVLVYDTNGNALEVKDIKKGNVVYAQLQSYDGDDVAVVTVVQDNKVTGEVGSFKEDRVEIGGKTYKAIKYTDDKKKFDAYYSVNGLDDIKAWDDTDFEKDFEDAYKEEVTAYLDATGKIAFLTTDVDSTSGYKYGVVTRTYADTDRVRVFTSLDGKEAKDQIYKADKDANISKPRFITMNSSNKFETEKASQAKSRDILGQAVKFKLNKDGEISKDEFYLMDQSLVWTMNKDFGKDTMSLVQLKNLGNDVDKAYDKANEGNVVNFAVSESIDIISADGLNPLGKNLATFGDIEDKQNVDIDDFDLAKWSDMKEDNKDTEIRLYVFPKNDNRSTDVDGLVFVGGKGANTGSDEVAVYVTDKEKVKGDITVDMDEYGKGKQTRVIVDGADNLSDVTKERAYIAKHKSNGKVELFDATKEGKAKDFKVYRNAIVKSTGADFEVKLEDGTTKTFVFRNNPLSYYEDKSKSAKKGDLVDLIVEDNVRIRVVGIVKEAKDVTGNENTGTQTKGLVSSISATGFVVDGKDAYFTGDKTILRNPKEDVLLIGKDLTSKLNEKDQVEVKVKDNIVTEVKIVKFGTEFETANKEAAEKAVTAANKAAEEDLTVEKNLVAAEKAVKDAEKAIEKVSKAEDKAALTNSLKTTKEKVGGARVAFDKAAEEAAKKADKEAVEAAETAVKAMTDVKFEGTDVVVRTNGIKSQVETAIADDTVKVKVVETSNDGLTAKYTVTLTRGEATAENLDLSATAK